jgi:hypothetical protein
MYRGRLWDWLVRLGRCPRCLRRYELRDDGTGEPVGACVRHGWLW